MPRIAGTDLPLKKKVRVGLTYIFGIGFSNVEDVLRKSNVDGEKRNFIQQVAFFFVTFCIFQLGKKCIQFRLC